MRRLSPYIFTALIVAGCFGTTCNGASKPDQENNKTFDYTSLGQMPKDTLPAAALETDVDFRDMNAYTSNEHFCVVSIVDNAADTWQKIWVKITLIDASGNALQVNGDTSIVVSTFSDAVPPRGATAFFCAIPLSEVSGGTPVNCRLEEAGAVARPPGPILLATEVGGVRAMYADKDDPTKVVETIFDVQATMENPLDMIANHPRVVFLVYGKDGKLYFAQSVNPEEANGALRQEREGPLAAREKRKFTCRIFYKILPQPLIDLLIGRVDVQMYEAR